MSSALGSCAVQVPSARALPRRCSSSLQSCTSVSPNCQTNWARARPALRRQQLSSQRTERGRFGCRADAGNAAFSSGVGGQPVRSSGDSKSQLKHDGNQSNNQSGNALFTVILLNIAVFVLDHVLKQVGVCPDADIYRWMLSKTAAHMRLCTPASMHVCAFARRLPPARRYRTWISTGCLINANDVVQGWVRMLYLNHSAPRLWQFVSNAFCHGTSHCK